LPLIAAPLPARSRLEVERPELVEADHDFGLALARLALARLALAVGDRVEPLDPGFLRCELGSVEPFQVLRR
jgi:hypothetical protein